MEEPEKYHPVAEPPRGSALQPTITHPSLHPSRTLTHTISRAPSATHLPCLTLPREIALIAIISTAQLLTQSALAQSIAPLHIIGASFHVSNPALLSWLPAAYSLTVGTFILPAGRLGDLYGHKRLFVAGYLWFAVWSLIAGFSVYAHSIVFFAVCRAMQGIGPALLLPNGIAILSRTYPPGNRKAMVLSIFGACAPGGFVVGAAGSGVFAQLVWWPWAYWVLGGVLFVVAGLAVMFVPHMPVVGGKARFVEMDLLGSVLGVVGLVLVNFAWNQGPVVGWQTVYVYVLLIVGFLVLAAFFYVEARVAEFPLVPLKSLTRDTLLVFGCIAAGWSSFGIWVYYLWQMLEVERGHSVLLSAAQMSPTAISGLCAAITTGFLISKFQPGWIMLASMTAFAIGITMLATMPVEQIYWSQTFVSTVITSWGMDMSFPSGIIVLSNSMPEEYQGLAASLINTVVNYSISIGLGMAGTVESHVNDGGKNTLKGYRGAWYLGIGMDVLAIIISLCLVVSWRATLKAKAREEEKLQAAP